MNSLDLFDILKFEDQFVFYQAVNSVTTIELELLVLYWRWKPEMEFDLPALKFMGQALFVDRFK